MLNVASNGHKKKQQQKTHKKVLKHQKTRHKNMFYITISKFQSTIFRKGNSA